MNLIPWILLVPLGGAACAALCGRKYGKTADYIALAAELAALALAAAPLLLAGCGLDACELGLVGCGLRFAGDGFRQLWAVLICFAFTMSGLMCPEYLAHSHARARYQAATLLALAGTLGVFLSADLFTFFVCFELMSLSSWLWVLHEETPGAKYAAGTYLGVAVLGGLVLLMGLFTLNLLGCPMDFLDIRFLWDYGAAPRGLLYLAGGLMLFGFAAKAGVFPLHFWMPLAYPAAPAPASALLSGVLSKCGVLGMLLLSATLFRWDFRWGEVVLALGVVTMLLGAVLALCSVDLKRVLAYSSASQIGFITVGVGLMSLLGLEDVLAVRGTVLHMMNHTLIKLVLFLAAGVFAMNWGTLDLNKLRGAGRGNLPLMLVFLTGAYAVAGVPGGSGYLSKTMLHEAVVEYTELARESGMHIVTQLKVVEWLFLISGGLTLAYMLKLFITLFLERPEGKTTGKALRMGPLTAAALVIPSAVLWVLGLLPHQVTDPLLDMSQGMLTDARLEHRLQYFSGTNLSGACISLAIGVLVYLVVVRKLLMRDGGHRNVVPAWCDLERNVYRPVLLRLLPNLFGLLSRLVDCSLDGAIVLLRKTLLVSLGKPKREVAGVKATDTLGRFCDRVHWLLNHTVRRKNPKEHRSYVYTFAEKEREAVAAGRLITASLSFGLLLACVGLVATLAYLLL
ncbi:sodium:proton antiporter [Clostridiaceae bacterium]|nr:sodium:proton antiporter [Clostridiaceae bacterium]